MGSKNDAQWTAWSFQLGNAAFKMVRPITIEMYQHHEVVKTTGYLWWKQVETKPTDKWCIKLLYDCGPNTCKRTVTVMFNSYIDADYWFQHVVNNIFLRAPTPPRTPDPNKPRKRKRKAPHLKLIK